MQLFVFFLVPRVPLARQVIEKDFPDSYLSNILSWEYVTSSKKYLINKIKMKISTFAVKIGDALTSSEVIHMI